MHPIFPQDKFITAFKGKAKLFNSVFPNQFSSINSNYEIPTDSHFLTDNFLSNLFFTDDGIVETLNGLNLNTADGQNKHLHDKTLLKLNF